MQRFYYVCTRFGHGYMVRNTSLEQTNQAKRSFEVELSNHNVKVKAHRADNGRFVDIVFRDEVQNFNQAITYCGVVAHHQNSSLERHVSKITTSARIILLHAKRFWTEAITHVLLSFAVADAINM